MFAMTGNCCCLLIRVGGVINGITRKFQLEQILFHEYDNLFTLASACDKKSKESSVIIYMYFATLIVILF